MVVGGGPAGMEVARVATLKGHDVTLYEMADQLGGQLLIACRAPYKEEINNFTTYLITQIEKLGTQVKLNTMVTPDLVSSVKPDVIIIATGALPFAPDIPGINKSNVVTAWDVLSEKVQVGQSVVVVGGGLVGCETAEYLFLKGKKVTIVEMLDDIALDIEFCQRLFMMERFTTYQMNIAIKTEVEAIIENGVIVVGRDGIRTTLPADTVILATGSVPDNELASALEGQGHQCYLVGDCLKPKRLLEAVHTASYIARQV
jgi:NADPH-dependent 2,4-dienoyl-CoA reductase/sulfur reductase-like enzyme